MVRYENKCGIEEKVLSYRQMRNYANSKLIRYHFYTNDSFAYIFLIGFSRISHNENANHIDECPKLNQKSLSQRELFFFPCPSPIYNILLDNERHYIQHQIYTNYK